MINNNNNKPLHSVSAITSLTSLKYVGTPEFLINWCTYPKKDDGNYVVGEFSDEDYIALQVKALNLSKTFHRLSIGDAMWLIWYEDEIDIAAEYFL